MIKAMRATLLALAAAWAGTATAQVGPLMNPDVSYSATRVLEAQGQRIEQRYYHRNLRVNRADTEMKGQQSSMIMRLDRNLVWIVTPQQGMYLEMSLQDPQARARMANIPDNDGIIEYRQVGREPVDGIACRKFWIASQGADGERVEGHIWLSDGDDILMKMDLSDRKSRAVMELRDLEVAPQADSLFEPPAGYRKMAFGGGAGGLGAMMGGAGGRGVAPSTDGTAAQEAATAQDGTAAASEGEPGFAEEVATEAAEEAKQATKNEVRNQVRDTVRDNLRKIFGN